MRRLIIATSAGTILLAALMGIAWAQTGGGYDLTWHTIDAGGTSSASGGAYVLAGTIGQADVGSQVGGAYALQGGFWTAPGYLRQVYLPVVARSM